MILPDVKEYVRRMNDSFREQYNLLVKLGMAGVLQFDLNDEKHKELLKELNDKLLGDMKIALDTGVKVEECRNYYAKILSALSSFVIPEGEKREKEPEPKRPDYSFYDDFGVDIGAIRHRAFMADEILDKAEKAIRKYINKRPEMADFGSSKKFIDGENYKKLHHEVTDWLKSVQITGSLSPLETVDRRELDWLEDYCDFQSIEDIEGMTSFIISGIYNVLCPSPSEMYANESQVILWCFRKGVALHAAREDIHEFARYLWKKAKEG